MIHLITYGDEVFKNSKKRLFNEARRTGWFDTLTVYGPSNIDDRFKEKFKDILKNKKGGGFWIWKPYFIKKRLSEINENDILIYMDAGCSINPKGVERFKEYIDMLNKSEESIISFQMSHHPEKKWTTKEIFDNFSVGYNSRIANSGQIIATVIPLKKNKDSQSLINRWLNILSNNPKLFTDYYNENQEEYFKENRHDQSVFSLIRKKNDTILIEDETFFLDYNTIEALKSPFWATRKK